MKNPLLNTTSSTVSKSPNDAIFSDRPPPPPLRVADILLLPEDDYEDTDDVVLNGISLMDRSGDIRRSCSDCNSYSPRRIITRWVSGLWRSRVKRIAEGSVQRKKEKKGEEGLGDVTLQASCSINGLNGGGLVNSAAVSGGQSSKDASFNMGVGLCLLYLVAASKNELSKMTEMRMQMETLLGNTRQELLKQSLLNNQESESNDVFDYLAANALEGGDCETQILAESSKFSICDQFLRCETPEKEEEDDEEGGGRNQLEAELEVELERLQFHLDTDKLMKHTEQLRTKKWEQMSDEQATCSKTQTMSSGEVIDPHLQDSSMEYYGVSPNELERRLHELLEQRQQEQIKELEDALECMKLKLHEKELEISWWKDTAMLISQQATTEPSQSTSQGEIQMYDSESFSQ